IKLGRIEINIGGEIVAVDAAESLRNRLATQEARRAAGRDNADQLANLLVQVRERLASASGLDDQQQICRVVEALQQVRNMVDMAGKAPLMQERVWGVATMQPNTGLRHEVEVLNWTMAVLMGRSDEAPPRPQV